MSRPMVSICTRFCLLVQICKAATQPAVAHIQCQICGQAVTEVHRMAQNLSASEEESLADLVDGICSLKKKEGQWLLSLDIIRYTAEVEARFVLESWLGSHVIARVGPRVESLLVSAVMWFWKLQASSNSSAGGIDKSPLLVLNRGVVGECKRECHMIHRACSIALKGKDDLIVSLLSKNRDIEDMQNIICKKTCERKLPKLESFKDEVFKPRDPKELETEAMMAQMAAAGMNMQMFDKDQLLSMSEGDMETMAAREAFAAERNAEKARAEDL